METIRSENLAKQIDALLERVVEHGERIVVQSGTRRAVLVSTEDVEFLDEIEQKLDQQDAAEIDRRRNETPQAFSPSELLSQPTKSS